MIHLTINGQTLEVPIGSTVFQAAESIGITIPTLCFHKDLSPFGGCRFCVVEVEGARLPMTSCILPVNPGMVVHTDTPNITRYRRAILRMLLSNYYDAGYKRYNGKFGLEQDSQLAYWARFYEVDIRTSMAKKPHVPVDSDPNPFVWVDMNKCIQCTRCVRACAEIQGRFVWAQAYRGFKARIVAGNDSTMLQSRCESCGACVVYCPTGALDNKMSVNAGRPDRFVRTTCSYCGVGCQFDLNIKDDVPGGRVLRVTSTADPSIASVNAKHLCLKGRYGYEFIHHARRHTRPRLRQYLLDGAARPKDLGRWVEVDWETALNAAAAGLRRARNQNGVDAIAVLASGRLLNEEIYLLNKLARQVLGTNHIDISAHLNRASVTAGLMESCGLPAMANSFEEIEQQAQSFLAIGSNLTEQHPVFGAHIRQAILRRKIKMVVASPDFVNIAEYAALSLYHRPNTETALLNGLMHILLEKGWVDHTFIDKYPQGYPEFKAVIDQYAPKRVAQITGLKVEQLHQAAEILHKHRPTAILWSLGLADPVHGPGAIQSLVNLQLLLGGLDLPGGGLNPLRSQCNSQGACDLGAMPEALTGYQWVTDEAARHKFEKAWGTPIPVRPGMTAGEMIAAAERGRLRALYILGEDLMGASSDTISVRRGLEACDFIVLQEIISSDTTRYADVLLPGVSFAEKTGTFTNSERRIQMVNQAIQPIGESRPDWQIIADLARRILAENDHPSALAPFAGWDYADTNQIMQESAALTPIYAGVSHNRLAQGERLQWPVDSTDQPGSPHLSPGYFSAGQMRWSPIEQIVTEEQLEPSV